jgi:hypothetical protein
MSFCILLGSFLVLLLFTSLDTQTVTITVTNPSLTTFNDLQVLYSDSLKCPCSTVAIPYQKFLSLSPILHQVCSSDFVGDSWLSIMEQSTNPYWSTDWRNIAAAQLKLLSNLCELANNTIDDAVNSFLLQSFVASTALTEINLNAQLNGTLNQLFQSTVVYFGFLVDTAQLLLQVDQLFMGATGFAGNAFIPNLIMNLTTSIYQNAVVKVCLTSSRIFSDLF